MILITGMLFLLSVPFFIYWCGKEIPKMKKWVIVTLEVIAIGFLVFNSVMVILDIPYIIKGGQLYEGEPLYMDTNAGRRFDSVGNDSVTYYMDSNYLEVSGGADIYVLPHTRMVYKIENNSIVEAVLQRPAYHIKNFGEMSFVNLVAAIMFFGLSIWSWYKWNC
ncbi:MAG: hypothetical protein IJO83_05505 [Clostridia bacterium]|nr:hypothetical protein [Clostridia bacterium]